MVEPKRGVQKEKDIYFVYHLRRPQFGQGVVQMSAVLLSLFLRLTKMFTKLVRFMSAAGKIIPLMIAFIAFRGAGKK